MLTKLLAHPLTRGLDLDDPETTQLRIQIIKSKLFLRKIYQEWYETIVGFLPGLEGNILEIGSGAGFLNEFVPGLIPSDVFLCANSSLVLNAQDLPFNDLSLAGIVMVNVLHHLPNSRQFFKEATRCIRPGGMIIMIEPWLTTWSKFVYTKLHHEPFHPETRRWEFPSSGPLSGANGALPWIILKRDLDTFQLEFPEWRIQKIHPFLPFRYLFSGGVSMRQLAPGWSYGLFSRLEQLLEPWMDSLAMFALICLVKINDEEALR
jgi:SAM-dependent methyltransferase